MTIVLYNYRKKTHKQVLTVVTEMYLPTSQSLLIWHMLQCLIHPNGPSLDSLQFVHVFCVLEGPELAQIGYNQCWIEGTNHLPWPPGDTVMLCHEHHSVTGNSARLIFDAIIFILSLQKQYFYFCFSSRRNKICWVIKNWNSSDKSLLPSPTFRL